MTEPERQQFKDNTAASHAEQEGVSSSATRAKENSSSTTDDVTAFVRDHPYLTVSAGLAMGILFAGLFPSARRVARKGGAQAAAAGASGAETLLSTLQDIIGAASEAGRAGAEKVDDLGDTIGDTARNAKRDASYTASKMGDKARISKRDASKSFLRAIHRFTR